MPRIFDPSDADLVRRSRGGDRAAFAELVRRHGRHAVAVAQSVAGPANAEDAGQEALLRAWTNLDLLVDGGRFRGWLGRIAFAVAIDELRRDRGGVADLDAVVDPAPLPDEALAARRREAAVMAAIAALPARYRRPLVMYHLEGLRHDRIAWLLGVPAGTVRSMVTRARATLQKELAMEDDLVTTAAPRRLLHVTNGDSTRMSLEQSGVPGRVTITADVLCEGPCPPVDGAAWWEVRGRFLAGAYDAADARSRLEEWDRALDDAALCDEVILWFEHDLFDQLLLIRLLDHFADRPARLSLICIGEHPAVPAFKGLGELTPDQLASLYETRGGVDGAKLALGRDAWAAYRASDPTVLERLLARDLSALPFLARAFWRHLEEYPWVGDGLTRTERQILLLVRDGESDPWRAFRRLHALEDCRYVADAWYLRILRGLAAESLLGDDLEHLSLTPLAHEVLAGRADRIATAGIDRWLGGVHLEGSNVWRWDPDAKRLVR